MAGRRGFLIAGSAGMWMLARCARPFAQQSGKVWRIGYLGSTSASASARNIQALRAGLQEFGYVEGKNLVMDFRWADGDYGRLLDLAAELVRLKPDVVVTAGYPGGNAAKQAITSLPVVVASAGDLVSSGLVASEARPGGNITGVSSFTPELNGKRLELLKDIFPRLHQIAVLWNPNNPGVQLQTMPVLEAVARSLKVELRLFAVRSPAEFESAFATMSKERVEAVTIADDPMMNANAAPAARLAMRYRIPAGGNIDFVEGGGLIGYSVNQPANYRRAATLVDKIFKGAKPADLPIERATKFELTVNLKTAKALAITIPQSILVRADRVIE